MSKKLITLAFGSLVAAHINLVAIDTQASEQSNTKEKRARTAVAEYIQNLLKQEEQKGLAQDEATKNVVKKIEQGAKALTGTAMLSDKEEKILIIACLGVVLVVVIALLIKTQQDCKRAGQVQAQIMRENQVNTQASAQNIDEKTVARQFQNLAQQAEQIGRPEDAKVLRNVAENIMSGT
jgi:hypothetical protein